MKPSQWPETVYNKSMTSHASSLTQSHLTGELVAVGRIEKYQGRSHTTRVEMDEHAGQTVVGPFSKHLFNRKTNKNIISGGRSQNCLLGILCTLFALRKHSVQLYPRSGYGKLLEKA